MRIGIDASFLRKPATGIGQVTVHFLRTLKAYTESSSAKGNETEYVLYMQEPLDSTEYSHYTVKSYLPTYWKRDDVIRQWLWERQVAREAVADGCDAFLSLYQSATVFRETDSVRHSMLVHDIIPKLFPVYIQKWSERWHYRAIERGIQCADQILAVSQSTKRDLMTHLDVAADTIQVAYPGLSPVFTHIPTDTEVREVLRRYGLQSGYIYHGGGLEIRKNTERVLRAYVRLRERQADVPQLVISGQVHRASNRLATNIAALLKELHLENEVRILGRVPEADLPALYRGALCFVFPSLYEGFGLPALEALAMGCPTLASSVASLPEVCGQAAVMVNPQETESIANALYRVCNDDSLRERLKVAGIEQAKRFSYDTFTRTVIDQCI